jgi:hypothetical protein
MKPLGILKKLKGSIVEKTRFRLHKKTKKEGVMEWCSALSRMNEMKNYALGKGKRDTAPIVCYT